MLDKMAKRYGVLPHELLHLDFEDFLFDLHACHAGIKADRPQPVVMVEPRR